MHDILVEQGILAGSISLDELYTMRFLEKVYGEEL
jgi:hypothetical protein